MNSKPYMQIIRLFEYSHTSCGKQPKVWGVHQRCLGEETSQGLNPPLGAPEAQGEPQCRGAVSEEAVFQWNMLAANVRPPSGFLWNALDANYLYQTLIFLEYIILLDFFPQLKWTMEIHILILVTQGAEPTVFFEIYDIFYSVYYENKMPHASNHTHWMHFGASMLKPNLSGTSNVDTNLALCRGQMVLTYLFSLL